MAQTRGRLFLPIGVSYIESVIGEANKFDSVWLGPCFGPSANDVESLRGRRRHRIVPGLGQGRFETPSILITHTLTLTS